MILGYLRSDYMESRLKVPATIVVPKRDSSILIAGKSGSGKSLSARWYLWQLLRHGESRVYLSDYKAGEEYEALEGSPSYASGSDAIEMILKFYEFFTTVRDHRVRLVNHYTLFIEEWFGLLTYAETQSKKLKTELMAKVGELLAVSRGLNMGVICCVQRADASLFSSGTREQFQVVLSFGRTSQEQFRMLGFSNELEENRTADFKPGEALALVDGQEEVQEILVPWVRNPQTLCDGLRYYLDQQPELPALTRAVAGGDARGSEAVPPAGRTVE